MHDDPGGGRWRLPMTPRFYEKNDELEGLKKQALAHMAKFNHLKLDYKQWFMNQSESFLDVLKRTLVDPSIQPLLPKEIKCMADFKKVYDLSRKTGYNRARMTHGFHHMEEFMDFWNRFCVLKQELDLHIVTNVTDFCSSVSRLRHSEVRDMIEKLNSDLTRQFSDEHDFSEQRGDRENLFVYKVTVADQQYLGLVGYLPYLLTYSTKICYLVTKVYIEKE